MLQQQEYLRELRPGCHLISVHALPLRQLYPTFILYNINIIRIYVANVSYYMYLIQVFDENTVAT